MIGKLTGRIDSLLPPLIVDVNGVGYVVATSAKTLACLSAGATHSLWIETHVREDAIQLYGFFDTAEQRAFRILTSVQGVGARVALAILGVLDPDRLALAIAAQDKAALTAADGVGPKLAARLVTELKDRFDPGPGTAPHAAHGKAASDTPVTVTPSDPAPHIDQDALSALVNLGYARSDAYRVIATLRTRDPANAASVETLIRAALRELAAA